MALSTTQPKVPAVPVNPDWGAINRQLRHIGEAVEKLQKAVADLDKRMIAHGI